eukprot:1151441-Pelagomonas_calceolata.AAC.6
MEKERKDDVSQKGHIFEGHLMGCIPQGEPCMGRLSWSFLCGSYVATISLPLALDNCKQAPNLSYLAGCGKAALFRQLRLGLCRGYRSCYIRILDCRTPQGLRISLLQLAIQGPGPLIRDGVLAMSRKAHMLVPQ